MRAGEGVFVFLAGAFGVWGAWLVPPPSPGDTWAGVAPMAISCLLLVCGALMIIGGGGFNRLRLSFLSAFGAPSREVMEVFALALLAFAYYAGMVLFGYILPTFVIAPAVLFAFGVRGFGKLAAAAVLCPLLFYLAFFVLLGAYPPRGEWFEITDYLQG